VVLRPRRPTPLTDEPAVWTGDQWLALAAAHLMPAEAAASGGAGPGRPLPPPTYRGDAAVQALVKVKYSGSAFAT
jgi:hypothetical protein